MQVGSCRTASPPCPDCTLSRPSFWAVLVDSHIAAGPQVNDGEPLEVLTDEVKDAIMKNIRRRMTPQPVKIRADVELTCFSYDGILHIQVSTVYCPDTLLPSG